MKRIDKYKIIFFWIFRFLLIIAGALAIYQENWINLLLAAITMFLISLPSILEKRWKFDYPRMGELVIVLFIFASMYLGELQMFYVRFWWWDLILHALSGVIIADIGFSLVYLLNKKNKIDLSPFFVALFSFSFALAVGTVWEIFEFLMDSVFGVNMQKSGLVDTMWDLIVDASGALMVSYVGYLFMAKKIKSVLLDDFEKEFVRSNKKIFK